MPEIGADRLRFLTAGSDGFLVELDGLDAVLTLLDRLRAAPPAGIVDLVPAARTLMVRFDPMLASRADLVATISALDLSRGSTRQGESFDIPVRYDGEDLGEVANLLGWTVEALIRRHGEATYTVAFTGFVPGFAYMTCDDPAFDVPRRESPRVRIPAGSVALGGKFGGIYPSDSPGGWQLLGRTPLKMWDTGRPRAALLAPGDRVRFRDIAKGAVLPVVALPVVDLPEEAPPRPTEGLRVTRADRPALFQDLGRPGQAGQGVAESGALYRAALIEANLCLGNPRGTAVVEITFGGFALAVDRPVTLAVTGAPAPLAIRTAAGHMLPAPFGRPFALDAGDALSLGLPPSGLRSYLGLRGGFAVASVLGSVATDMLAGVGAAPIVAGDMLVPAGAFARAVDPWRPAPPDLPKIGETVTLDIVFGPRMDWFAERALALLLDQPWEVTAETNRVGIRLAGAEPLEKSRSDELLSEGTPMGAIQVPHSGQPVLFLADHPLTGGYPVIAVVARHHLDLAGQIPIGAWIRFNAVQELAR